MLESGRLKKASTLAELAGLCGIDADGLAETVEHFNEHAANGVDPDYGRGESAYNRSLGDPNRKVHPCLGPIDEAPYYACEVLPGDIGTCGGLVTDEHARVLDEQRPAHRGPLRHRQQHRHGHGPPLPRPGCEHRQHDGVRVPRGAARGRGGEGGSAMADELAGKVAIVTGGGQRHRSGHRRALRRRGRPGRRSPTSTPRPATAVAAALGDVAAFQPTDVTDADQVQALVDFTVERFGGLHVMVNNAGVASAMTRFLHDDLSDFHRVVDINVLGVLLGLASGPPAT